MKRILHVEDENLAAELVRRYMAEFLPGVEIDHVSTLEEVPHSTAFYDAMLIDLNLSGHNWRETLRAINGHWMIWPPVVCYSGRLDSEAARCLSIEAGAEDFISKERWMCEPHTLAEKLWLAWARRNRHLLENYEHEKAAA